MAVTFDPEKHVIVNLQNRPTTVYSPDKKPITVQPYRDLRVGGVRRNEQGIYILTDPHFASFVSGAGPLYLKPREEVEKHAGAAFQTVVDAAKASPATTGTPMGKSAATVQAETAARHNRDRRAARTDAAAAAHAPTAAVTEAEPEAPAEDGPEVELHTHAELEALPMDDLRAYAANWSITGRSRRAIIDKLADAECIAADE